MKSETILRTPGQGQVWNVFGESIVKKISGEETFGRFAVVEESSPAGSAVPPHFHNKTDEIIYVLDGSYEFTVGERVVSAVSGDVIFIPRKTVHGFKNLSDKVSKMLAIITPSGFENFFAGIDGLEKPEIAEIVELGRLNDLELTL